MGKAVCYYCNQEKGFEMIGIEGQMKCLGCGKVIDIEKAYKEES